jgi:hypothetical protein
MNEKELLEIVIDDINLLKLRLDDGDIDVYCFYEEVIHLKDFIEKQLKQNEH